MNPYLRSKRVDTAFTLSTLKLRSLFLIRQGVALAFLVFATAAFSGDFKSGPLGAVEIKHGQPIEIRVILSDTVVPSVSLAIRTAIEIAVKDFGSIHGRQVFIESLDEMCSGEGGRATAEAVVADAQVVGVIGTLCSGAAVEASPVISEAGLSMISPSNTSPVLTSDGGGCPEMPVLTTTRVTTVLRTTTSSRQALSRISATMNLDCARW